MNARDNVVCSFWIFVFVCCLHRATSDAFDIQCTWPAFNCKAKSSQKSFALSRELRGSDGIFGKCSNLQWKCDNGQCIAASSRCNGMTNCIDGSDETDCQGVGYEQDQGTSRLMTSRVAAQRGSRDTMQHNCTVLIGPEHEQFCRRRHRGYYGHPVDCERYIVCEWGEYHECQCPPLTRWDMRIVSCIWKHMAPCLSRDSSTAQATQLPASQIARLIELFAQYELNRQTQLKAKSQVSLPSKRDIDSIPSTHMGIPVSAGNRNINSGNTLYNGNSLGSVVQ